MTLYETLSFIVFRCFFSTLFFFLFAWVFVRYIGFALERHVEEAEVIRNKLVSYGAAAVIALFGVFWYYQTMFDDSCVTIRLAMDCVPEDRKRARRALYREIKLLFGRKHISIPYTHLVVSDYRDEVNTYIDKSDEAEGFEAPDQKKT